jgi:tetratricopeptide (TPR) repeat protein
MGIYFYRQAKYNEAITLFSEGLTFKSQDWGMYTNRGDCYKAISQYVKALEDYLKAY